MPRDNILALRSRRAAALALAFALGGCDSLLSRRDSIDPALGDATAANIAMQVIDPWPRDGFQRSTPSDGGHAAATIESYRAKPLPATGAPSTQ